jgi:hypothetical protein
MLGFEALTGALDDFGFEDYLNCKYLASKLAILCLMLYKEDAWFVL